MSGFRFGLLNDARVVRSTEKALLISVPELDLPVWIPRSVVHEDSEVWDDTSDANGPGKLILPMFVIEDRNLDDVAEEYP